MVWQVADTSRAVYAVDDYDNFVRVQAESALDDAGRMPRQAQPIPKRGRPPTRGG